MGPSIGSPCMLPGAAAIAGVITIGRAADESSILGYKVYFGSAALGILHVRNAAYCPTPASPSTLKP